MVELLRLILDNPWNFFGVILLMFVVGTIVNMWLQSLFYGKFARGFVSKWRKQKERSKSMPTSSGKLN